MATDADIPLPVCEARGEHFVDNIVKISVSEVPLLKQNQDDKLNELLIVEGENFLKSPLTDEVHCEANNVAPNVSKVAEKTSAEESQQNAEESNSKDGDGDRGVVPEKCSSDSSVVTSEMKEGDTTDYPCTDDATAVTQLSNETSSDHHGTYDSSTENVALTKEILLESSLASEETESQTPCISEGEELNVQSKTTDDKSADEKPTEEDMSSNLTNEITLEQKALENERSVEENFNTVAEKASHGNSGETITTLETSNGDKLHNESDLNTSLSKEESQQNAEESNSIHEDGDRGVVPEQCSTDSSVVTSELKVGDTTDDPCTDNAMEVPEISKETSSDHQGTCDSSTENVALTKEILLESSLPSEETESHTPCISEGGELYAQSKTIDDKSADEKPSEEDLSSNLTNEMTSDKEPLENERGVEYNFNTAAEKASHENSTPQETITTLETSNGDKLESKSDLNTPLSKEEETAVQKGDRSVTTSEDHGVTSEKTLSESHGDLECQSKTLEDAATDHNDPKLAEKSEESSPVQVEDSQIEHDQHFEEESERLPLTEVLAGVPDDRAVPEAMDNVKDKDKDLKEAEVSENEQSTSTLVKEDVHKGNPAESSYVTPENIEVSDLTQENSVKALPEEQSRNVTLHGDTIEAEDATINADDRQKESFESFPTIVSSSHEEASMNAVLQEATSDHKDGKIIEEVDNHKEVLENLSSCEGHCEVNNVSLDVTKDTEKTDQTVKDGSDTLVDRPIELAANEETSAKEIQWNAEESNSTDKDGDKDVVPEVCSTDSSVATSETKVGDTIVDPDMDDAEVVTQLSKDTSSDHHGTNDSSTKDVALTEEILQEADPPGKETESHAPCISEGEEPNVQVKTTDSKSVDDKPTEEDISCSLTNEVSKEEESDHNKMTSEQEELESERSVENSTSGETNITLETSNSDELQSTSELNSSLSNEEETVVKKSDEPVTTTEDYGVTSEKTLSESHGDVECQSKTLEDAATDHSDSKLTEKSEESSVVQVEDSQTDHNEHLEEESEGLPLTESSTGGTNDNVSAATGEVKEQDEDHKGAELSENEQSTKCTLVKEDVQIENPAESLHVALDNIEVSSISQEKNIEVLTEVQSTNTNLQGNTIEAEEATIDAAEEQKDSHESFPPIVCGSPEEESMNAVLQEVTSDYADEKIIDEVDKHKEVSENLSTTVSTEDAEGISLVKLEGSENKSEDDSGKESEETPLPLPVAREVSDASTFLHEARFKDGEPKKAEFCDDESMLPKTESRTENTEDAHVNSEDAKAPDSVDKRSEGGTVDAAAEKKLCTQADGQETENKEHLDKENEQVSSIKEPSGAELFEKEKITDSVLLTEEVQNEKTVESLHAALEDIKISDFDQHTEATGILEEQTPAEYSQGIPSDEAEETGIDAANTNEKTQELQNVSNEDSDKDLLIKEADSEMTRDINLEEELERPSLTETSKEEASDIESILLEPKTSDEYPSKAELPNDDKSTDCITPKKESLQPEDHKTSTSSADIDTACSLEEQSLEENSQTIISNKIIDAGAADKDDLALENVATETPHEHIEENSVTQVDCSAREHEERMEEVNRSSSLIEAPAEETDARESKNIDEPKNRGEESITPELENGENTESTHVREETDEETPIDSLQVKPEDIKQHDSSPDINKSIEEAISNADPREISTDKAETETVDAAHANEENVETKDVAKDIPDCDKEDSIPIEEVSSQYPLNEASAGNANDEESTKITEDCLITKEEPLESLQVADQDIETPPLSRDRETSSLDEENPTTNPEAIIDDNKEEIPDNATGEDETPKEDIVEDISDCGKEDNMPTEEVGSQNPLNGSSAGNANIEESTKITEGSLIKEEASLESLQEAAQEIETPHLSREREISSPDEQSPIANSEGIKDDNKEEIADSENSLEGETPKDKQNIANTTPYEDKEESMQVQEDRSQQEQNESENIPSSEAPAVSCTESSPVEEEVEIHTEEQILTANPQETCDEQEKTVDAANKNNDVVISALNGDKEDNSPIEVDGLQEPSSEEVPAEKIHDDGPTTTHEAEFANENTVKANLNEDEGKIDCALVKEEVHIESLQVADEDIKDTSSGQDREASHLEEQAPTTYSHETMVDEKYAKTLDSTDLKQETLEDKNYVATPDEDTKEDSRNQEDDLLLEQEEHLVKDSESTSVSDAPKDDITESTLVKEVAKVEDPIDSSQVATEDIKAFAPCQDTEKSSTVEQIIDPEDISSNKITEKTVDATGEETQEAQDIAKSVPREDDSPNEENSKASLIKEDASIELPQIAAEDREEPCLSEVRETNSQEEQILCASPGVPINENEEIKTIDPTTFENETPEDEVPKEMESVDVLDSTSMESEVSEKINDQVVGEANSCGDKRDLEKIEVLNDGPTAVPTSATLAETDSRGCTETEVQLPNGENEPEVFKREAENDQKNINETLPNYAVSEDISESKEVNGEEEISSNNCKEISSSPISVATEEVSTSNVALEEDSTCNSVTDLETKNEEEAPAIKETTPSSAEGQDAESTSVEENSNYTCSLTEEKSDSTEVAFMSGENESGYGSNNRGLKSITQGQSFDIISETEETKAEEENLKAEEAEIQSDKAVTEDILQEETMCEKEIMKDDISSEKEQLARIKEEHEDVKDYHQGSCEEEVKKDQHINSIETYELTEIGNDTETVPEVSEEAVDKAPEDLEEKIFTNEAIDRILHQEEQATSIEEQKTKIDNENARDLDIAYVNTDAQDSNKEAVQIAIVPGGESVEQNKEDEICSSDVVQEKDEEKMILSEGKSKEESKETYKEAYVEAEKFDLSSQTKDISECAISDVGQETPEDNEKSTTQKFSEEDYPKKITECEVSSASEDIALTEQPSEDASITAEVQEAKAGIDLGAAVPVPEAIGSESQEVEELNDKCTDTSAPVETSVISTLQNIGESTEGTPLEAEDQQTKLHEESNMRDTEVKMAEKDNAVDLQSVRDISKGVQDQESFGVSNNHNPENRTETSQGQDTNPIQAAPVSETLKQEIEEQKLGRDTVDVHQEEKNIVSHIPNQLESVYGADTEKVPESGIHQSSVENTDQHDKKEGNQQIDSPLVLLLPQAQCSDIKTSEYEPAHVGGLGSADATELEASPPSTKDKHEADDTRNLIPENLDGDKNISTEHSQGEHEVLKPSKVEREGEECRNEEKTDQRMEGKSESEETDKPSLSDLLHVSARGTSEMADHSPTEKEPTSQTEDMDAENIDEAEHGNTKTDEEKDDEEESHEHKKLDLGSEAPVMVDIGDADMKVAHKKSHNILSGVGSKVKHSIAKVKKAITGKGDNSRK